MLSVNRRFSSARVVLATLCFILAAAGAPLGQATADSKAILSPNNGGNLIWEPTARGLSNYSVVIPQDAIERAMRHEDTSALFYLSDISENDLKVSEGTSPWGSLWLARNQAFLDIHWPASELAYVGLQLEHTSKDNLNISATVNAIMASTNHSMHEIGLSMGEEIRLEAIGAVLKLGGMSEQFYVASFSSQGASSHSISYGQRYFEALRKIDFAWAVGTEGRDAFSSAQIEGDAGAARGFLRLTARENTSPILDVGLKFRLQRGRLGNWHVSASSRKKLNTALDGPSLTDHNRAGLIRSWARDVTLKALREAYER